MANQSRVGPAVAALGVGTALNPLNSTMVAVALIAFRDDFDLSLTQVTWVITAFYLASAALQPVMGRFADRFGPKRLFGVGMVIVAITCAVAPFSPNFLLVCIARVFLAIGTSTAFPSAVSMVTALSKLSGSGSARPLGWVQMANSSAAAFGPVIGGALISVVGWEAIFFINVPLALLALVGVAVLAPADGQRERGGLGQLVVDSDFPGIGAFTLSLVSGMMAVLDVIPAATWWLASAAIVFAALFVWRELVFRHPFINLRTLGRNRRLLMVYVGFMLFTGTFYCVLYGLPQMLELAAGYDTALVGALMFPLAAVSVVVTPFAARALERWGVGRVQFVSALALVGAVALLWALVASSAVALVVALAMLIGIPYSVINIAASQGVYSAVPAADRGVAAGVLQTARYIGAIGATASIGVVFGSGVSLGHWGVLVAVMVAFALAAAAVAGSQRRVQG